VREDRDVKASRKVESAANDEAHGEDGTAGNGEEGLGGRRRGSRRVGRSGGRGRTPRPPFEGEPSGYQVSGLVYSRSAVAYRSFSWQWCAFCFECTVHGRSGVCGAAHV